MLGFTVALWQG